MRAVYGFLLMALLLFSWGCAKTYQARRVRTSGFLGDYSRLEAGKKGEALLVYRDPYVDFSRYDKVIIDAVEVWQPVDSRLADLPEEDAQRLGTFLHDAIVEKLAEDYEIVKSSGPGVLRLRVAITDAAESWVVLDTLSSVLPTQRLAGLLTRLTTGTTLFVGRASAEAEIVDAQTGQRLFAGVDRRIGSHAIRGTLSSWDDVQEAYLYWAERIRDRLRKARESDGSGSSPVDSGS